MNEANTGKFLLVQVIGRFKNRRIGVSLKEEKRR